MPSVHVRHQDFMWTLHLPNFCSSLHTFSQNLLIVRRSGIKNFENTINKTTTSVLALHPVTCVLTFLTLLISLQAAWRPSRQAHYFTLILSSLATLVGTIVFFVDLAVVSLSEKSLKKATDKTLDITWGNAVSVSYYTIEVSYQQQR